MATIGVVMMRLLPHGTRPQRGDAPTAVDWRLPPDWPPDLFAVAATLVNLSGAYAHSTVTVDASGGSTSGRRRASRGYVRRVERVGGAWAKLDTAGAVGRVVALWTALLDAWSMSVSAPISDRLPGWCHAALELLAIADEASAGIGFVPRKDGTPISAGVVARHFAAPRPGASTGAWRTPSTLCKAVPPEQCCVQPKSRTPQVGCTLRSLSHNLALLPAIGEVTTSYYVSPAPMTGEALNLLLVPFPYEVDDGFVVGGTVSRREGWGHFEVSQTWLPSQSADRVSSFLRALVQSAGSQSGRKVHGVVLPELALGKADADAVAERLARSGLRIFITGALARRRRGEPAWNGVMTYLFQDGKVLTQWSQAKHHRWRIEKNQVESYGLKLDPRVRSWWERIDVANRLLTFYAFHEGATLATLVCEDLARVDPVQPALRAVGPNLLIAILMDGPQLPGRWSGKYATALAEDPGTSVLTLTSAGLVDRSNATFARHAAASGHHRRGSAAPAPSKAPERTIALWMEADGKPTTIALEKGSHAVLLGLSVYPSSEEFTMDRRGDHGATAAVTFGRQWQVTLEKPPAWLAAPGLAPGAADWRAALRAPDGGERAEPPASGYPKDNRHFDREASRVLRERGAQIARLGRFSEEWARAGLKVLAKTRYA